MSNYYGKARTNYFRVDPDKRAAFDAFAAKYKVEVLEEDGETGRVALCPGDYTDDGSFPGYDPALEAEGKDPDICFIELLSAFLAPGSVAILMETGHDKLRYLGGYAIAIDHTGHQVDVGLNEIYKRAEAAFPAAEITRAEY